MKPVDYNQKLNDINADYRKKFAEQRAIHRQELDASENRTQKKIKNQQEAYSRDRRRIESESEAELGRIKENTDDLLDKKLRRYGQALEKNKKQYEKSMMDSNQRFDKRFGNAQDAYKSALDNIKHIHKATMRSKSNDMEEKIDHIRNRYDEATDRMQHYTENSLRKMKDKQIKYRDNYMRSKQRQIEDLNKAQSEHLMDIHEKYRYKVNELKEAQAQRVKSLKDQMRVKTEIKRKKDDDSIRRLTAKYDDLFADYQDTNRISARKQEEVTRNRIAKLVDQHKNQLDFQERKYYEASTGGGEVDNIHDMNSREKEDFERRIENLKEQLRDRDLRYLDHNKDMVKEFTEDMRNVNQRHRNNIEDVRGRYRQLSWDLADDFRKDKAGLEDRYRKKIVGEGRLHEAQLKAERDRNNKGMYRLKKDFGQALHTMSEKNIAAISNLQQESASEKRTIIEGAKEKLFSTTKELRDQFEAEKELLIRSYEEKDIQKRNELISMEERYEGKLAALKNKLGKLIRLQLETHEELRDSARKKAQGALVRVKKEGEVALIRQRDRFTKTMGKIKRENDQTINDLTNYYEGQLLQQTIEHNRKMREKLDNSVAKYQQYVQSSEIEKEQMRQTFEAQMDGMRARLIKYKNSRAQHA